MFSFFRKKVVKVHITSDGTPEGTMVTDQYGNQIVGVTHVDVCMDSEKGVSAYIEITPELIETKSEASFAPGVAGQDSLDGEDWKAFLNEFGLDND